MNKLASYVGLAQRAGDVVYGEDIITEKLSRVFVVLVDKDAPCKYKERLIRKCSGVDLFEVEALSDATHRINAKAIGVLNKGLADAIINLLR